MSAVSGGGNYVSDSAILAWVENCQNSQYGQLRNAMDFESTRAEMIQDVAVLRKEAQAATKGMDGILEFDEHCREFQEKYGSIPEFSQIAKEVADFGAKVASKADQKHNPQFVSSPVGELLVPIENFNEGEVKTFTDNLQSFTDAANHNEQLAMIRVNEIKSTIDHSADLASQLIKTSNDTSNRAINNIA